MRATTETAMKPRRWVRTVRSTRGRKRNSHLPLAGPISRCELIGDQQGLWRRWEAKRARSPTGSHLYPRRPLSSPDAPCREAGTQTGRTDRTSAGLSEGPGQVRGPRELEVSGPHAVPCPRRSAVLQRTSEPGQVHAGGTGVHRQEDQRGPRALRRRGEDPRGDDRTRGGHDPSRCPDQQGHRQDELRGTPLRVPRDESAGLRERDRCGPRLRGQGHRHLVLRSGEGLFGPDRPPGETAGTRLRRLPHEPGRGPPDVQAPRRVPDAGKPAQGDLLPSGTPAREGPLDVRVIGSTALLTRQASFGRVAPGPPGLPSHWPVGERSLNMADYPLRAATTAAHRTEAARGVPGQRHPGYEHREG